MQAMNLDCTKVAVCLYVGDFYLLNFYLTFPGMFTLPLKVTYNKN